MAAERRRFKQSLTLQDRLIAWSGKVREQAGALPSGPHRDELLKKARQAELPLTWMIGLTPPACGRPNERHACALGKAACSNHRMPAFSISPAKTMKRAAGLVNNSCFLGSVAKSRISSMTAKQQRPTSPSIIPQARLDRQMSDLVSLREKVAQAEACRRVVAEKGGAVRKSTIARLDQLPSAIATGKPPTTA